MSKEASSDEGDLTVYAHSHSKVGFDWQRASAPELIFNAGFSRLKMIKSKDLESPLFCVGVDDAIDDDFIECEVSQCKVAVILETKFLSEYARQQTLQLASQLDFVFTHDEELLSTLGEKAKFLPLGGSYLRHGEKLKAAVKDKSFSMSVSRKNTLEGHILRHKIAREFFDEGIDFFGRAFRPYRNEGDPLRRYRFSIVVENAGHRRYFTEKLIHPLLYRTIPVYWGATSLPEEFDERGIVRFRDVDELRRLLPRLDVEYYESRLDSVHNNQRVALQYSSTELNFQRIVAQQFQMQHLNDGIEMYFPQVDDVLNGRKRFEPRFRTTIRPEYRRLLPIFVQDSTTIAWAFRKYRRLQAALRTIRRP